MDDQSLLIKNYVKQKISSIAGNNNESAVRTILANLRRGIGESPGSIPALWEITFNGFPEALRGKDDSPSKGEWAIHTALTLYALHQQGKSIKHSPMNQDGISLGTSLRRLISNDDDEKRVKRRFDAAATSDSLEEISHHLRGLVNLLKSQDVPLDYSSLASELYWFQNPDYRDSVRLGWGREFYRIPSKTN